ncbi:hypothetical protein ACOM2C_00020 [Pseudarthrobacter sp. So.54]
MDASIFYKEAISKNMNLDLAARGGIPFVGVLLGVAGFRGSLEN